jgi:hypothetical protein
MKKDNFDTYTEVVTALHTLHARTGRWLFSHTELSKEIINHIGNADPWPVIDMAVLIGHVKRNDTNNFLADEYESVYYLEEWEDAAKA